MRPRETQTSSGGRGQVGGVSSVTYFARTAVPAPSPHLEAKAVRERPSVQRDLERCVSQRLVGGVDVPCSNICIEILLV